MAKLLSYYNLCSISDEKDFLGLSQDADSGSIINTLGRNLFYTIQLSNQQQIYSWTVLDKLTNRVVYNFKSQKYVGVFGNRYIRCWNADTKDINKIKKIKLSKTVADLVAREGKDVIVVYTDGTCESLSDSLEPDARVENTKQIVDIQTETIFNISSFTSINEETFLIYFVKTISGGIKLIYYKIDSECMRIAGSVNMFSIARREQVNLVGYAIVEGELFPSLITIWSDKRIFMLPLSEDGSFSHDIPGYFVSMLNAVKVDQPLTIIGISKDCVAIYGANENQEGAWLVLYNTQFSVIQSKQYFKVYFHNSRLWVGKKHILLSFGQNLACVSFQISREQLSDMIGSQRDSSIQDIVNQDSINEENDLEEGVSFVSASQIKANERSKMNERNLRETDNGQFSTSRRQIRLNHLEKFQTELQRICRHNLSYQLIRDAKLSSDSIAMKFCSNLNDGPFNIEEVILLTSEMEKCGVSEFEITDVLIPILIKAQQPDELATCLRTYTNISDRRIVETLKYYISLNHISSKSDGKENLKLINTVLSCSFNDDLIREHLRTVLKFDDVIFILNYLYKLIKSDEQTLQEMPQRCDDFDEDAHLLLWFSTILDANFQQFILSQNPKIPKMVKKWQELINDQLNCIRDASSVMAMFYNLVQGKHGNAEKQTSKWYSVELTKLY